MENLHSIDTPYGVLEYSFARKRVKRINLRVRADGSVAVSAPARAPRREVERFLLQKAGWVHKTRAAILARPAPAPCDVSRQEALARFAEASERIFPLFADILGGVPPTLKVRDMKTRWGVCNHKTRTITLTLRLAMQPTELIDYVVLHEYVHFIHPDHQAGFHAEMARLMPDYKQRRAALRAGE